MKYNYICTFIVFFFTIKLIAQQPFQLAIGQSGLVYVNCITALPDSGVVIGGSNLAGLFIAKFSKNGSLIWEQSYLQTQERTITSLTGNSDGSFLIAGSKNPSMHDQAMYMMRVDSTGNVLWSKSYGSIYNEDEGYYARQTSDGGFILSGRALKSYGASGIAVIKTDSTGTIQWSTLIENPTIWIYGGKQVIETADGSFFTCGYTNGLTSDPGSDGFISKISSSGNVLWTKIYGTLGMDYLNYVAETNNGELILAGYTDILDTISQTPDLLVLKTDSAGSILWSKTYTNGNSRFPFGVSILSSDALIYGREIQGSFNRGISIKIDSNGDTLFSKIYYGYHQETSFECFAIGAEGSLWFGGAVSIFFGGFVAGLLVLTDSTGVASCNTINNTLEIQDIVLDTATLGVDSVYSFEYPDTLIAISSAQSITNACLLNATEHNPSLEDYIEVSQLSCGDIRITAKENTSKIISVSIIDITGKTLLSKKIHSKEVTLSTYSIDNGLYFVLIKSENREYTQKILLTR